MDIRIFTVYSVARALEDLKKVINQYHRFFIYVDVNVMWLSSTFDRLALIVALFSLERFFDDVKKLREKFDL